MSQFAVESLLAPLDGDQPSGPNLEYDAEFQALERAAAPKAERAVGDSVQAAEEPDWAEVAKLAEALLGRTKDLRVATLLTTAWLNIGGMMGWVAGLTVMRGLVENFWGDVHPQLDAEDNNDPTFRVNSVAALGDPLSVLRYFRTTPFVQSPRIGRFSLRDLRIANGTLKLSATGDEDAARPPSLALIEGCCTECPIDEFTVITEAVSESLSQAKAIDGLFTDQVGSYGPDLKLLLGDIAELKRFLDAQLASRGSQSDPANAEAAAGPTAAQGGASPSSLSSVGGIGSAKDVSRLIDQLCDYYVRAEPASPVPLLLRRAQRLIGKSFVDLLQDLAPGGLSELQTISGVTENQEE